MEQLLTLIKRLRKIGIDISCSGNYPWIYLDTVNGNQVKTKYESKCKFTIAFMPARVTDKFKFTDLRIVFNEIRNNL